MKTRKIVITDKNRRDYGRVYEVYKVWVSYYFQINQKDPTPAQIELEKSQFKYVNESKSE